MNHPKSRSSMKCNHFLIPTWFGWVSGTLETWHHDRTKVSGSFVTHCCIALDCVVSIHVRYSCHHSSLGQGRLRNWSSTCRRHSLADIDSLAPENIINPSTAIISFVTTHGEDVMPCVVHSNTILRLPPQIGWITGWRNPLTRMSV